MIWRLLLAAWMAASVTISWLLPVRDLSRFVIAGLLFAVIGRAGFAIVTRRRKFVHAPGDPFEAREWRNRSTERESDDPSENFRSAGEP